MIVIASHDNQQVLRNLLQQISDVDLNGHRVLIIDTNSKKEDYLEEFKKLKKEFKDFIFERKDYDCYDSGAYIHAYKNYNEKSYIFLQDSIEITSPDVFKEWDRLLELYDVVPMYNIWFLYDNAEQASWAEDMIEVSSLPTDGIFGPIFGVTKKAMDSIPNEWLKEPTTKNLACGMERRWSLMFHAVAATKEYMVYLNQGEMHDFLGRNFEKYAKYIKKFFLHHTRN
jgi:hypothetical protein